MYEHWTFDYEGRIFATPVIHLGIVDKAIEELEWCLERGAEHLLVRPAPVPGFRGTRSIGPARVRPVLAAGRRPASRSACTPPTAATSSYLERVGRPGDEYLPFKPTAFRRWPWATRHRGHHGGDGLPRRAVPLPLT